VAGAAREHPFILAFGLILAVVLMGIAADLLGDCWRGTAGSPMGDSRSFSTWPVR
jgi:hypothetical protein